MIMIKRSLAAKRGEDAMRLRERRKKGWFTWFNILLIAIIVYFSSILISQQFYLSQVNEDQAAAEARLAAAQEEHDKLVKEKENLGRLDYIEKIAREQLGMTRKGELPYNPGRSVEGN